MKFAIGSDHAGYQLKQDLVQEFTSRQYELVDVGTHDERPADYPDLAEAVCLAVLRREAERGVVICGSGVGACIAANKIPNIRAGLCHDRYSAQQGVEHDDMNVLVLGARIIDTTTAIDLVNIFLQASFSGADRHVRRLNKIRALEARYGSGTTPAANGEP